MYATAKEPPLHKAGLLVFFTGMLAAHAAAGEPIGVRFVEGLSHGFLTLRTVDAAQIAPLHPAGAAWRIELTSPRWPD
jgi:hypothetical protein